jgi:ectoine hydroxylase-related dioxygenase (phytanoyl-CoA dioxygenase family)
MNQEFGFWNSLNVFIGTSASLVVELQPTLNDILSIPFNSLFFAKKSLSRLQNNESLNDLCHVNPVLTQLHHTPLEVTGSHCVNMCQVLLNKIHSSTSIKGIICPSWYASDDSREVGHAAVVVPFYDMNHFGCVILDPGLRIKSPIVINNFPGKSEIPGYICVATSDQLVELRRVQDTKHKANFVYGVTQSLSQSDYIAITQSMLQRKQFSFYDRNSVTDDCKLLVGVDYVHTEGCLFVDFGTTKLSYRLRLSNIFNCEVELPSSEMQTVSSNKSRIDRAIKFYFTSPDSVTAALNALLPALVEIYGDYGYDIHNALRYLCSPPVITAIKSLSFVDRNINESVKYTQSLTLENFRDFERDGYVLLKSVISSEKIEAFLTEFNAMIGNQLIDNSINQNYQISSSENRASNGKLIYNCNSSEVWSILEQSPLKSLAQSIFGDKKLLRPDSAQIAVRFPLISHSDTYSPEARKSLMQQKVSHDHWHIDGQWESNIPQFSLLVGVYLTECPEQGYGSLTVFPGSHRRVQAMLKNDFDGFCSQLRTKLAPALCTENDRDPIELVVSPGDVVLVHPLLAHRAGENWSSRIRPAIYYRLKTDDFGKAIQKSMIQNLYCEMSKIQELQNDLKQKQSVSMRDINLSASANYPCFPKWSRLDKPAANSRVYVVTGGNRGIGLHTCRHILSEALTSSDSVFVITCSRTKTSLMKGFDDIWNNLSIDIRLKLKDEKCTFGLAGIVLDVTNTEQISEVVTHLWNLCPMVSIVLLIHELAKFTAFM